MADPVTGNNQQHEESRDGDVVRGKYTVVEPDGTLRTVTYTADAKNGFQVTIKQTKYYFFIKKNILIMHL